MNIHKHKHTHTNTHTHVHILTCLLYDYFNFLRRGSSFDDYSNHLNLKSKYPEYCGRIEFEQKKKKNTKLRYVLNMKGKHV